LFRHCSPKIPVNQVALHCILVLTSSTEKISHSVSSG
jgi:hypothetical protein